MPDFYSIYVDELLSELAKSKKGCYYLNYFASALFYADDMAILAPSVKGLESLLKICGEYCSYWDICLNAGKSRCLYFGKRVEILHHVSLNGGIIEWTNKWTYLGVMLKSNRRFDCSVNDIIKKFYRCANSIFRIEGPLYPSTHILY